MTNEQKNKMIDDRILQNELKMFDFELSLVATRIAKDEPLTKQFEEAIQVLKQANEELERMKVV